MIQRFAYGCLVVAAVGLLLVGVVGLIDDARLDAYHRLQCDCDCLGCGS